MLPLTRPRRLLALATAAILAVAACGTSQSTPPTASPTATPGSTPAAPTQVPPGSEPDPEQIYQSIEDAVVRLRELEPKQDVEPQLLSEQELKERTAKSFREDNPPELIEANEILYGALGMIPDNASLTDLYIELLGSQVAGFYEPDDDELYVVARSGKLGVSEQVTYAHEFTHALQDQHFDLESFGLDEIGFGDRNVARLALIEGDATATMTFWAQSSLTPEQALELLQASADPDALAILQRMPPILRESLTFPYEQGLQLVLRLQVAGWEGVNDAYANPPASTEQVMHPEKYDAREAPIEVDLPDDLAGQLGEGWTSTYEDTFGEFQFQVWLRNAIDAATGNPAAAGWGGDRFAVLQGPNDSWGLVMKTAWDTAADAAEFEQAAAQVVGGLENPATVLADGSEVSILVASDGRTLNEVASAAGFVVSG